MDGVYHSRSGCPLYLGHETRERALHKKVPERVLILHVADAAAEGDADGGDGSRPLFDRVAHGLPDTGCRNLHGIPDDAGVVECERSRCLSIRITDIRCIVIIGFVSIAMAIIGFIGIAAAIIGFISIIYIVIIGVAVFNTLALRPSGLFTPMAILPSGLFIPCVDALGAPDRHLQEQQMKNVHFYHPYVFPRSLECPYTRWEFSRYLKRGL